MSRTKLHIDRNELVNIIQQLEKDQTFNNRNSLAIAISNSPWGKLNKITTSVALLRIKEYNITPITPVGKRGRPTGSKLTEANILAMQSGRKKTVINTKWAEDVKKDVPKQYYKLVDRAAAGSKVASIRLMCAQCTNFHKAEIKYCPITTCALFNLRGYK